VLQVSQRGYYDWLKRPESKRAISNRQLLIEIRRIFYAHREVYGAPRIHRTLTDEGHCCSLNRVARLMRIEKLLPKTIKKFRITTDSRNSHTPSANLLNRHFDPGGPNEKWVADVTYIPTREGWLFLAAVKEIVGSAKPAPEYNAPMESFFHRLKVEQVHHDDYRTRDEARSAISDYIEIFYISAAKTLLH